MRAAIIINPASGSFRRRGVGRTSRQDHARRCANEAGIAVEIVTTTSAGHAAELSAGLVAAGMDRIAVWGGDGTVNEAAGPLFGSRAALGIIPGGSGDGLARSLGLPRDPDAAIRLALCGSPRPMDVGWLGGRHFLNVAGIGFDAEVGRRFNLRARRGLRGYLSEILQTVWMYRCVRYTISTDGQRLEGPRFLAAWANGREYGNGLVIAPGADVSDGWLEMIVVSSGGPLRQLWRARRLFIGRARPAEGVWRRRVKSAEIAGERLLCHVDGEIFEAGGALDVRVSPGALQIISA